MLADGLAEYPDVPMTPRTLSVLVVDSYPDTAETTALVLLLNGFTARVTHNRREALATARRWPPDVVVLDIPLADGDGYELLAELRGMLGFPLLAVVVTGQAGCEARSRLAGCDRHYLKPLDPRTLVDLLEAHTGRPTPPAGHRVDLAR